MIYKKLCFFLLIFFYTLPSYSFGKKGHRTIALIANRNLTVEGLAFVKSILGPETLESVSTWADHIKSDPFGTISTIAFRGLFGPVSK